MGVVASAAVSALPLVDKELEEPCRAASVSKVSYASGPPPGHKRSTHSRLSTNSKVSNASANRRPSPRRSHHYSRTSVSPDAPNGIGGGGGGGNRHQSVVPYAARYNSPSPRTYHSNGHHAAATATEDTDQEEGGGAANGKRAPPPRRRKKKTVAIRPELAEVRSKIDTGLSGAQREQLLHQSRSRNRNKFSSSGAAGASVDISERPEWK